LARCNFSKVPEWTQTRVQKQRYIFGATEKKRGKDGAKKKKRR